MAKERNSRVALATLLWIEVQRKKLELTTLQVDSEQFDRFSKGLFKRLSTVYTLNSEGIKMFDGRAGMD
jgi:hypothetical protein